MYYAKENQMIKHYNFQNNEVTTKESTPVIEITHFNKDDEICKRERYPVGHFLSNVKDIKSIKYS